MKILHVHHALYLPIVYVRELCKRGVDAKSIYFNTPDVSWIIGISDYNFGYSLSYLNPRNLRNFVRFLVFFLKNAHTFDVVHFHSKPSFFPGIINNINALLGMLDLRYLRSKGTRIIYSHWGCQDGRLPSTFVNENDGKICKYCKTGIFGSHCSDKRTRNNCEPQMKYGHYIINHEPDFQDYNRFAEYHPAIIDFDIFYPDIVIPECYRIKKDPNVFYIYHSVANMKTRGNERGTNVIIRIIDQMKKDGYKIELITTDGYVNYKDVRYYQCQADLAIDNLYYGWYGNMVRECMAQAIPVATFINQAWAKQHMLLYSEAPPIINVNEESLQEVLEYFVTHRDELRDIGILQREYVLNIHSTDKVINRLLALYKGGTRYNSPE